MCTCITAQVLSLHIDVVNYENESTVVSEDYHCYIYIIYILYYTTHYKALGLNINLLLKGSIHVWTAQANRYPRFSSITKSTVVSFNAAFDIIMKK